jgi:hypothetical protein
MSYTGPGKKPEFILKAGKPLEGCCLLLLLMKPNPKGFIQSHLA